jgi:AcrR family transcriptional regulator
MSTSTRAAYHHGNLRETLVALALAMLEQAEPEQLTLRGLAEEAGVSGMAPYRHFEDKAALLSAVAEAGFVELRRRLASVDDERKPRKALIAFAVAYIGFACDKPNLYRVMFGGAPPTIDRRRTPGLSLACSRRGWRNSSRQGGARKRFSPVGRWRMASPASS